MKHKTLMLGLSVIVVLGLAAPALANTAGGAAVIVVEGFATVGKLISADNPNDGCDSVSGSGLGFPIISRAKNGYFRLFTPTLTVINSLGVHAGTLTVCGRLLPTLDNLIKVPGNTKKGIGASCGMSKGHDGKGLLEITGPVGGPKVGQKYWLTDVGWKNSAATLLPVTGKVHRGNDGTKGKGKTPVDGFAGLVIAQGGQDCVTKRDNVKLPGNTGPKPKDSTQGARSFNVRGVVVVVPDGAFLGNRNDRPGSPKGANDMPFFCKKAKDGPEPCAYKTKKPGQ